LTGRQEAEFVTTALAPNEPRLYPVESLAALEHALSGDRDSTVLLAFCTAVIVPRRLLERVAPLAYNIHPGPPNYPGRHPESWGAYHGATNFGATLHEMAPRVDEGAIIDVEWTKMPPDAGQLEFGRRALRSAVALLIRWLPVILKGDLPLPHADYRWTGRKTTHAEFEAMCRISSALDQSEIARRARAFAEAPGIDLVRVD